MATETATTSLVPPPIEVKPGQQRLSFQEQQAIGFHVFRGPDGAARIDPKYPTIWADVIKKRPEQTRKEIEDAIINGIPVTLDHYRINLDMEYDSDVYKKTLDQLAIHIADRTRPRKLVEWRLENPGAKPSGNLQRFVAFFITPETELQRASFPPYTLLYKLAPLAMLAELADKPHIAQWIYSAVRDYARGYSYPQGQEVIANWVDEIIERQIGKIQTPPVRKIA